MGNSEPWSHYKASFRRAASTDIQIAPKMKQIVDDLEQVRCNMDGIVFMRTVVGEIEAWRKTCRGASKSTH
eukprot:5690051-Pyramimonas_sp.AAC.1